MQEHFEDGSLGELHTANSLEELLPAIKKSLANPKVKFVKIWTEPTGKHAIKNKVSAMEEVKTASEELKELVGETTIEGSKKPATRTIPRKR
jgi:rubrerythrin